MDGQSVFHWTRNLAAQTLRASQAKTLAWIVASLVHVRHLNLPVLAVHAASKTTFKYRVKRLSRFLGNDRFDRLLIALAIGYCLLCGFGLKLKQTLGPSNWSTNKRDNELSVLSIARRMLGLTQLIPRHALQSPVTAVQIASPNWG